MGTTSVGWIARRVQGFRNWDLEDASSSPLGRCGPGSVCTWMGSTCPLNVSLAPLVP